MRKISRVVTGPFFCFCYIARTEGAFSPKTTTHVGRLAISPRPAHSASITADIKVATRAVQNDVNSHTRTPTSAAATAAAWYPRNIQETIDYDRVVQRLFVRHIVLETRDMAEWALRCCLNATSIDGDAFATVAAQISACAATKHEGGKIGWVDRIGDGDGVVLDEQLVSDVFRRRPKAGDTFIQQSQATQQHHVVQVCELWTSFDLASNNDAWQGPRRRNVGGHGGANWSRLRRKKLKGQGVTPWPSPEAWSTYHLQTNGCQMNVADSERLEGILQQKLKLKSSVDPKRAHVVMFNTCSIRDHAEQKLYDALGPYAARKRRGEQLALVVTGCVAQQEGEALLRRVPEVDAVLGPQYTPHIGNILEKVALGHQVVATAPMLWQDSSSSTSGIMATTKPVRGHDVRAWVNVIHGCNEHCTYCVVPGTRGLEQSRTPEAILSECIDLAEAGYKEVTLVGQNIDAYGRDMVPKRTFAELLTFLNDRLPANMRIRYITSHPRYFSDRVIGAVANVDKVCECFHMPFQAGDDTVLRNMRRGYTYNSYMQIIKKIRVQAPDSAICGDVIVGFPGETEPAFEKTLQLMNEVKFDNLNTFAYSPRPNTEAALWEDQVPEDVKADRLQRVQMLAAQHGLERSQRFVGRTMEVLVEDNNPRNPGQVMGRIRQGRQVYFDGDLKLLKGTYVRVLVTEAGTWSLVGKIAS